ncbi:MAG: InlB B-repeat-containing protein, partial [Nitrososphaeria archaeon]
MKKRLAVSNTIAGLLTIILGIMGVFAVTLYFYSGAFYVSQIRQLEQFLAFRQAEDLAVTQNSGYITLSNTWSHITRLTYVIVISSSGSVTVTPLNVELAPGQSYSYPYAKGYSYAFLTSYGNEFWASSVNNPALQPYTLTIEVNAPLGTTNPAVGTYVYPFGSKVQISAIPSPGYFIQWNGSGYGSYSGTNNPGYVYIWSNIVEEAIFGVQITFSASGLSGLSPSANVLIVNGVQYTYSQLPLTLYIPYGETVTYSYISPISGGQGIQFVWTGTSGLDSAQSGSFTADSSGSITATYQEQYMLTVQVNPSGSGTTSPAAGNYWYNAGEQVQITATPNTGYEFVQWSGSGSGSYSGTNNPATVTMNSPITETANFESYVAVTFSASGLSSSAIGTILTVTYGGTTYSLQYSNLPFTLDVVPG